jgi:hypothetical protein
MPQEKELVTHVPKDIEVSCSDPREELTRFRGRPPLMFVSPFAALLASTKRLARAVERRDLA